MKFAFLTLVPVVQGFAMQDRFELANRFLLADQPSKAVEQLLLLPDSPRKFFGLGKAYSAASRLVYSELEKTIPGSPYRLALQAKSRYDQGQFRTAFRLYRSALERDPAIPGVHAAIAEIYDRTGFPAWAEAELKKERGGPIADERYRQAIEYSEKAAAAYARLLALPASPEATEIRAESLWLSGKRKDAVEALQTGVRTPRLERILVRYLWTLREYDQVRPKLEALLRGLPADPELNYQMGELLLETSSGAAAVGYLEKATGILPARAALGRAYLQLNRSAEAIPHLRAAARLDEDGSLHYLLARALSASGNEREAKAAMEKRAELAAKQEARELEARGLEITAP